MGKPIPGFTIGIVDDDGNEVPVGEEGQIAVKVKPERPLGLFQEYWRDDEGMERSFVGDWYLTGDKAYKDEDGYHWFVGRADDVIISAGYRIGPFEVESALIEHPAVAESAVVASPDPVRGEIVKAFVILAPDYVPSDELVLSIQDHVRRHHGPLQVSAGHRVRDRATQDGQRQNSPRRAPRDGAGTGQVILTLSSS